MKVLQKFPITIIKDRQWNIHHPGKTHDNAAPAAAATSPW